MGDSRDRLQKINAGHAVPGFAHEFQQLPRCIVARGDHWADQGTAAGEREGREGGDCLFSRVP